MNSLRTTASALSTLMLTNSTLPLTAISRPFNAAYFSYGSPKCSRPSTTTTLTVRFGANIPAMAAELRSKATITASSRSLLAFRPARGVAWQSPCAIRLRRQGILTLLYGSCVDWYIFERSCRDELLSRAPREFPINRL